MAEKFYSAGDLVKLRQALQPEAIKAAVDRAWRIWWTTSGDDAVLYEFIEREIVALLAPSGGKDTQQG